MRRHSLRRIFINFDRLVSGTNHQASVQILRYGVVGFIAFVVDFTLLIGLAEGVGMDYLTSAAFGFLAGLVVNYYLSVSWVFSHRSLDNRQVEFLLFAAVGVAGLAVTEAILFLGTELSGMDYRLSKIVAVVVVLFWNFGLRKFLLFRVRSEI